MITVYDIKMDFGVEDMHFARELYGRWDVFYRSGVEEVMDRVFSRYDSDEEVIQVGRLEVDLGALPEEEFYERFPKLLESRLGEVFHDMLRHAGSHEVNIVSLHKDGLQVLLYFLLYGGFPSLIPEEYRDPGYLLQVVIEKKGNDLGRELRRYGAKTGLRRRLIRQFRDKQLEDVVEVTEPSESMFIKVYTRSLIVAWPRLRRPEIAFGDYRNVVWEVVWTYLFCEGRDFFSRKQLVRQTIVELARHFNLRFRYLLGLLTAGLQKMVSGWLIMPELSVILSEIRREEAGKSEAGKNEWKELVADGKWMGGLEELKQILSVPASCRLMLQEMKEEDIYRLVEIIIPAESPFVISYARKLEQDREKGMLEGKAGSEFRIMKWEFLFQVLLNAPASAFQRKRFVAEILRHIGVHYNIDPWTLLVFLCSDIEGLSGELRSILEQLYDEQTYRNELEKVESMFHRELTQEDIGRLKFVLLHPQMAGRLLTAIPEEGIYRLTRILIPAESPFIISYARTLEREKERGMLEGKGGKEFRVLKWQFIFLVVLSAPVSAFQRKQFIRLVLMQIAAHYNLKAVDLANYFYLALCERKMDFTVGIAEVLGEWIKEWQPGGVKDPEDPDRTLEVWRDPVNLCEWFRLPQVTPEIIVEFGMEKVVGLFVAYRRNDVADFIRKHGNVLWEFMSESVHHVRVLYKQMQMVEGLADFLAEVYGIKQVSEVLRRAGFWLPGTGKFIELAWQEALIRGDIGIVRGMLVYSPDFLRRKVVLMSLQEKERLQRLLRRFPDFVQEWLRVVGSPALRQALEEIFRLKKKVAPEKDDGEWFELLMDFTERGKSDFSCMELLRYFLDRMAERWSAEERIEVYRTVSRQLNMSHWEKMMEENRRMEEAVNWVKRAEQYKQNKSLENMENKNDENAYRNGENTDGQMDQGFEKQRCENAWNHLALKREDTPVYINNAGIVLLAPYFVRLFDLMSLTEKGAFRDEKTQTKAMFAMQYLAFGQTEFPETELALNKLLVGYSGEEPLPLSVNFTYDEREILNSLLQGAKGNWKVMQHTSVDGFRGSFLIRNGVVAESGELWQLTVEEKAYDILLDSLPWKISPVKLPWMEKPLYVNWR